MVPWNSVKMWPWSSIVRLALECSCHTKQGALCLKYAKDCQCLQDSKFWLSKEPFRTRWMWIWNIEEDKKNDRKSAFEKLTTLHNAMRLILNCKPWRSKEQLMRWTILCSQKAALNSFLKDQKYWALWMAFCCFFITPSKAFYRFVWFLWKVWW